jgi:hypothetical protein
MPIITIDPQNEKAVVETLPDGKIQIKFTNKIVEVINPPTVPSTPSGIFVSPEGKINAAGSFNDPFSLSSALAKNNLIKSGNTVWLKGGTYKGSFVSEIAGTKDLPIIFRPYQNEKVIIDGAGQTNHTLMVNGANVWFWGFEITNSNPDRLNGAPTCVSLQAPDCKLINLILHDAGQGVFMNPMAIDAEVYGCIIYNNGWQPAAGRGHGHGIYMQNDAGTKKIIDNLVFNQYGFGIHAYTEQGNIQGFQMEGNTVWNSGALSTAGLYSNILIGGYKPSDRITAMNNYLYHKLDADVFNAQFFYSAENNGSIELRNNYIAGGTLNNEIKSWKSIVNTGNTYVSKTYLTRLTPTNPIGTIVSDNNNFIHLRDDPNHTPFRWGGDGYNFTDWQAKGYDKNSKYFRGKRPAENATFIRQNKYEQGRAHITCFNWLNQASISVDLSAVLKNGDNFAVYNVLNLQKPILTGVYANSAINLSINEEFAVFLVKK